MRELPPSDDPTTPPLTKKTAGVQGDDDHPLVPSLLSAARTQAFVEQGSDGFDQSLALVAQSFVDGGVQAVEVGCKDGDLVLEGLEAGFCRCGLGS